MKLLAFVRVLLLSAPFFGVIGAAYGFSTPIQELAFEDPALETCIKTYAKEQGYREVADLKEIPCFHKGIRSLKGLEDFSETLVIDLSRNQIQDWTPLMGLKENLGYLDIHDNPILCSQMIQLARSLPRAFLVGFDPQNCIKNDLPTGPGPTPLPPTPLPTPPFPEQGISYQEVAPIIATRCGSCHQGVSPEDGVVLDTENQVKREARSMIKTIVRGKMPPRSGGWASTTEAQLLLSYLRSVSRPGSSHHDDEKEDDDD